MVASTVHPEDRQHKFDKRMLTFFGSGSVISFFYLSTVLPPPTCGYKEFYLLTKIYLRNIV